jgi:hypothetical protein
MATQREVEALFSHLKNAEIDASLEAERPVYFVANSGFSDLRQGLRGPLHVPNEHIIALRRCPAKGR